MYTLLYLFCLLPTHFFTSRVYIIWLKFTSYDRPDFCDNRTRVKSIEKISRGPFATGTNDRLNVLSGKHSSKTHFRLYSMIAVTAVLNQIVVILKDQRDSQRIRFCSSSKFEQSSNLISNWQSRYRRLQNTSRKPTNKNLKSK